MQDMARIIMGGRCVVIAKGRIVHNGTPAALAADREMMLRQLGVWPRQSEWHQAPGNADDAASLSHQ